MVPYRFYLFNSYSEVSRYLSLTDRNNCFFFLGKRSTSIYQGNPKWNNGLGGNPMKIILILKNHNLVLNTLTARYFNFLYCYDINWGKRQSKNLRLSFWLNIFYNIASKGFFFILWVDVQNHLHTFIFLDPISNQAWIYSLSSIHYSCY